MSRLHSKPPRLPAFLAAATLFAPMWGFAEEPGKGDTSGEPEALSLEATVKQLAEKGHPSMVVITQYGRDGEENGVGAGFVVTNGLVATCLHVIGESRTLKVTTAEGESYEVTEVHAWDRARDLALIRLKDADLEALPLGDSDALNQGAFVVALGNPMGLQHSVVQGVLSARREFDDQEMLQLAIPIEPGNSGGPLLDRQGRVHGILNMKSAVTRNLGFAIPINQLKSLIDKPNPVPMERWLTIGTLNPDVWETVFGARWRRKGGRIMVEEPGTGFGGRSLCLRREAPLKLPMELTVTVKLDDESGAAGLAFGSDGNQKHYGFYPSGGNLRLTRFDGPSVYTWTILEQAPSPDYRPGEWNTIKVRWETNRILCYVNGELAIESDDQGLPPGRAGLVKFRNTQAAFKSFQMGKQVTSPTGEPTEAQAKTIASLLKETTKSSDDDFLDAFRDLPGPGRVALSEQARKLESEARRLRRLADRIHWNAVRAELRQVMEVGEQEIDLFHAGLLIAKLDDPDLDVTAYTEELDRMATEISKRLPAMPDDHQRLKSLRKYLFEENGFHGSRQDYYNRANSYLNQVIDDREGIPITLSVIYMELAWRLGLNKVVGVPMPGHFIVKQVHEDGREQLIDPFEGGKEISLDEARERVLQTSGIPLEDRHMEPASKKDIVIRMLRNLQGIADRDDDAQASLIYMECIVSLKPDSAPYRMERAALRLRAGDREGAKADFEWIMEHPSPGMDLERLNQMYRYFFLEE